MHKTSLAFFILCLGGCPAEIITTGGSDPSGGGGAGGDPTTTTGGAPVGGAGGVGPTTNVGAGGTGGDPVGGGPPCDVPLVPPPAPFEQILGFTSSEDFVFDEFGNYVGIDFNGNLVRITKSGQISLWVPAISSGFMAGMVALKDGSVVVCDAGQGSLKRAYPNGSVTTIIGGLQYPNGVDVGPDGYIYVAENSDDHVRRVHPDTGEFTIAADGLFGPNGVAFSDDPSVFYVGSFEGGLVYKVVMSDPTQPGVVTEFADFAGGGGIDGMGVDRCGNVYAAEYTSGDVYRITPGGEVDLLVNLPSFWIPNIKWGRGLGGFERNVMYVADRDVGSLFGVAVNIEGATEHFDLP